jgi:hypothetical protein
LTRARLASCPFSPYSSLVNPLPNLCHDISQSFQPSLRWQILLRLGCRVRRARPSRACPATTAPLPVVTPTSPATDTHAQSRPAADAHLPDVHKPAHTAHHGAALRAAIDARLERDITTIVLYPPLSPPRRRYVAHCDGSSSLSARWGGRPAICVVLLYILAASPPLSGARRTRYP